MIEALKKLHAIKDKLKTIAENKANNSNQNSRQTPNNQGKTFVSVINKTIDGFYEDIINYDKVNYDLIFKKIKNW